MICSETTAVITSNDIPVNMCVAASQVLMNLGENIVEKPLLHVDSVLKVWYENGTLSGKTGCNWTKCVRAARDIQEQNLELNRDYTGSLYLRTIRHIIPGERLLAWYSQTLAIELGFPALTMSNIIEAGCYRCLQCGYKTGYPNILKSHMKFHCQRRLSCSPIGCTPWTTEATTQNNYMEGSGSEATTQGTSILSVEIPRYRLWLPNVYESKPPLENKARSRSAHKINTCIKGTGNLEWRAPSVLKYNKTYDSDNLKQTNGLTTNVFVTARDLNANYNTKCSSCDDVSCYKNHLYSKVYNTFLQKGISSGAPSEDLHDNEQMDADQNSLLEFSSRQGHMCLYCGKFYSRKYGLKIHLRTHTGYKPLKCKICKRPFGDPSNLNKHVRLHADGDTPYKCKFCGKVLVRRRDLARHIKSRHPESC